MTKVQSKGEVIDIKALLAGDGEFLGAAVKAAIETALEAEMTEVLGAAKGERTETRLGYRAGYYQRSLITRVARWSFASRRTARAGSRPSCSSATSARRKPW